MHGGVERNAQHSMDSFKKLKSPKIKSSSDSRERRFRRKWTEREQKAKKQREYVESVYGKRELVEGFLKSILPLGFLSQSP